VSPRVAISLGAGRRSDSRTSSQGLRGLASFSELSFLSEGHIISLRKSNPLEVSRSTRRHRPPLDHGDNAVRKSRLSVGSSGLDRVPKMRPYHSLLAVNFRD